MQQGILNMYNNIVLLVDFALINDSVGRQSNLNVTRYFLKNILNVTVTFKEKVTKM